MYIMHYAFCIFLNVLFFISRIFHFLTVKAAKSNKGGTKSKDSVLGEKGMSGSAFE